MTPTIYLPTVGTTTPVGWPCGHNEPADRLYRLTRDHPQQQRERVRIICHPLLVQAAQAKAEDMHTRVYTQHIDPDGHGANWLVRQTGYPLPPAYGDDPAANYVESIASVRSTSPTVPTAWIFERLLASPSHRRHLLGETGHFRAQLYFGVGFSGTYPGTWYWCILSAPPP